MLSPDLLDAQPAALEPDNNKNTAPPVVDVAAIDTTTTATSTSSCLNIEVGGDSTGVPYNIIKNLPLSPSRLISGRRERSSPLASMDSNSSSSPIAAMKMGSFPPPPPPAADPVGDNNSDQDAESDNDLQNELNNNNNRSYKNSSSSQSRTHDSRRIWYLVGGAIFLVVIIAAIASGAVTSSNNKKASAASSAASNTNNGDGTSINIPLNPQGSSSNTSAKSELYLFIESLLPDGGLALQDAQSYQSMALQFIQDTHNADYSLERVTQRFVLACIYHATYAVKTTYTDYALGENSPVFPWLNSNGWLELENECEWFGITCNNNTNTNTGGLVETIDLHENLLTGTFPPETALLKNSLLILDIEENIIYNAGNDGLNWLGELVNLQELNIAKTSFQYDGIPLVIGKLVNLVELDVSYSLFFGPLHEEVFENLHKLQFLYIGGNSYNSSLPASIGRLDSLLYLYAEFSDITGDLSFLATAADNGSNSNSSSGLSSIYELWVDKNPNLSGKIPTQIGHLTTLASLSLTECDLYGKIPTEMGNLINMKQLWLYGNRLTGDIPANLGNMRQLDRLELEDNDLQGEMPSEVCANVYPRGRLEVLEADCGDLGKISCNATECCTCCGPECAGNDPQSLRDSSTAGTSGGTRNPNNRKKQRRLDFFKGQQQQQRQHSL